MSAYALAATNDLRPRLDHTALAHKIMKQHSPQTGWQRIEPRPCSVFHTPTLDSDGRLVLWHKKRNCLDNNTFELLDATTEPPLWVAEHVPATLCCTAGFHWINTHPAINRVLPSPWRFSGPPAPGSTLSLRVANGSWLWQVVGDRNDACGGWLARRRN
jgi:hypothetical protein